MEIIYDTAYLIWALVFLAAFGIHWPLCKTKSNKKRTPIEEMTIDEHETTLDEEKSLHRQLTRKLIMLTKQYMSSTAKK
jgi:hypothetical protein